MNLICPLCNGLKEYTYLCNSCNSQMKDVGPVVDYLDEYSPYLSKDLTQLVDKAPSENCIHLLSCEKCNKDKRKIVDMILV